MKIQINGFDIEINTEDEAMSMKVIDASGKELSNNTYTQTLEASDDITDVDMPTVEETTSEEGVEETTSEEGVEETTSEEDVEETTDETTDDESLEEGFIMSFEAFKKSIKK